MTDYKIDIDSIYAYAPGNTGTHVYRDHAFTAQSSGRYTASLPSNPFTVNAFHANIRNATDYFPFGMMVSWRFDQNQDNDYLDPQDIAMNTGEHRYGFNGKEKDDEVAGSGNSYTALFWQYDSRLGRRWNVDPLEKPWMSSYHVLSNNPLLMIDPNGDSDKGYTVGDDGSIEEIKDQGDKDYGGEKFDMLFNKTEFEKGNSNNYIIVNDKNLLPQLSKINN